MLKQALVVAALLLPSAFATAHEYTVGDLHIAHPWSLQLPPNAPNVAAYFVVHNNGQADDRLLSVDSPISDDAQLHEHAMTASGAMKRPISEFSKTRRKSPTVVVMEVSKTARNRENRSTAKT